MIIMPITTKNIPNAIFGLRVNMKIKKVACITIAFATMIRTQDNIFHQTPIGLLGGFNPFGLAGSQGNKGDTVTAFRVQGGILPNARN